jgi:hypothetical protein
MNAAYGRFLLCLALFLGWLGYLGYLVAERSRGGDIVLSRPQFLVSDLDVVAAVTKGSDTVTVVDVLHPDDSAARHLKGKQIQVTNLDDCRPPGDPMRPPPPDLQADGNYLLPLQDLGPDGKEYRVVATPPSPGFRYGTPRIYPATPQVLAQYKQIRKN